jgi:hypothetical protein
MTPQCFLRAGFHPPLLTPAQAGVFLCTRLGFAFILCSTGLQKDRLQINRAICHAMHAPFIRLGLCCKIVNLPE